MMTFFLLSLAGLPPTAGFFGKLLLFGAAIQGGLLWLAIVAIVNAVIAVYYYWNVVRQMYLRAPAVADSVPATPGVRWALGLSMLGTLGLFILAQRLLELVNGRV
jgi:NADH-quinone oxidoreductase subunit N